MERSLLKAAHTVKANALRLIKKNPTPCHHNFPTRTESNLFIVTKMTVKTIYYIKVIT